MQVGSINLNKEGKNRQWSKDGLFISGVGKTGQLHVKKVVSFPLIPCTKIDSKWIKGLNVRSETIKLVEDNICITV